MSRSPLFDHLRWTDPVSGRPLEPIVAARTPAGVPICGALRIEGTDEGYPIVDCVARLTPELAGRYATWLEPHGLRPPRPAADAAGGDFQNSESVASFGWQWGWDSAPRSEADLQWRVLERFGVADADLSELRVLDAGAGAGDQSAFLLRHCAGVVSVDLSDAIHVVAAKLRMHPGWVGVQGDITRLPLATGEMDLVYCEGVIQHTRDSTRAVRELARVVRPGGRILASHYVRLPARSLPRRVVRRVTSAYYEFLRSRLSGLERYKLLLVTGNLAALSYLPLVGFLVRRSGTALYYDLMPDLKATWTRTFDYYGQHAYQRFLEPGQFARLFRESGNMEVLLESVGAVVARKDAGTAAGVPASQAAR